MSWKNRQLGQTRWIGLGTAVTLTGTNPSAPASAPSSQTIALFTRAKLQDWVSAGEVWRPLGVQAQTTTTLTVTVPAVTLQKAPIANTPFAAASSGGVAAFGALRTAPFAEYIPFTNYLAANGASNFTADAAGDVWQVAVSTAATAGAAIFQLGYALIDVAGISDAFTTY